MQNLYIIPSNNNYSNSIISPNIESTSELRDAHSNLDYKCRSLRDMLPMLQQISTHAPISSPFILRYWLHLLRTEMGLDGLTKISFNQHTKNFTEEDITGIQGNPNNFKLSDFFLRNTNMLHIDTLYVKRGKGIFPVLREQDAVRNMRYLNRISLHLQKNSKHHIDVYEYTNRSGFLIVTNGEHEEYITVKTMGCIFGFMEHNGIKEFYKDKTPETSLFLSFCRVLYTQNLEDYARHIAKHILMIEEERSNPEYMAKMLTKLTADLAQREVSTLEQRIETRRTQIAEREQKLLELYSNLREDELTRMKYNYDSEGKQTAIQELLAFIQKANHTVKIAEITEDGKLVLDISVPISTYRRNDVMFWYKNPNNPNSVNEVPIAESVIRKTFLDEEYDLMTTTRVSINLVNAETNGIGDNYDPNSPSNRYGNPHISYYNCFSSTKSNISKAVANCDYVTAVSLIINACSTITFTDTSVIRRIVELIRERADELVFRRKSDKVMCSANQIFTPPAQAQVTTTSGSTSTFDLTDPTLQATQPTAEPVAEPARPRTRRTGPVTATYTTTFETPFE